MQCQCGSTALKECYEPFTAHSVLLQTLEKLIGGWIVHTMNLNFISRETTELIIWQMWWTCPSLFVNSKGPQQNTSSHLCPISVSNFLSCITQKIYLAQITGIHPYYGHYTTLLCYNFITCRQHTGSEVPTHLHPHLHPHHRELYAAP